MSPGRLQPLPARAHYRYWPPHLALAAGPPLPARRLALQLIPPWVTKTVIDRPSPPGTGSLLVLPAWPWWPCTAWAPGLRRALRRAPGSRSTCCTTWERPLRARAAPLPALLRSARHGEIILPHQRHQRPAADALRQHRLCRSSACSTLVVYVVILFSCPGAWPCWSSAPPRAMVVASARHCCACATAGSPGRRQHRPPGEHRRGARLQGLRPGGATRRARSRRATRRP